MRILPCPFCGNGFAEYDTIQMDIGGGDTRRIHRVACNAPTCKVRPMVTVAGESGYHSGDTHTDKEAKTQVVKFWNLRPN